MRDRISTVLELIEGRAASQPQGIFLVSPETGIRLTFKDLDEQVIQIRRRLQQMGLQRGDKVAFLLDNGLFTAQLFLGAMAGGFVVVPLNARAGISSLAYTLEHCDASVVFVETQYHELYRQVSASLKRAVPLVPANVDALASADESMISDFELSSGALGADDVALLMYTSGSTGKPKAAVHTHRTILAHGTNSVTAHQLTEADCSLLVLPLYHINAECVTLIPTLLSGGTVVIPHYFSVSHFWDWLEEYRCTWSAVVPTIISQLLDWKDSRMDQRKEMFKRVRFMRSSSAPLSPALHREFLAKFDVWLIQAMGSSECGNIFSNPQPPGENKIGSPGLPWGFELKIVNVDGQPVTPGEPGEVLLKGPALMQGYYKDPEGTATVIDSEGWFHTGDLAYQDSDGYVFVVGRSKELVIKGGVNIAPKQVDEVLESHPTVLEAAAVGVPDRYLGEDLVAFVVLRSGQVLEERELLSFCENRLGHFKTPTRIFFTDNLPKGPSGKIQRLKLLDRAVEAVNSSQIGNPAASKAENLNTSADAKPTPIEQTIAAVWMELLKLPHVGLQSNFFSLGGHSLLAIQSLSKMRERLPTTLSLSEFFENATVAQLAALIRKRLRPDDQPAFEATVDWEKEVLKQIGHSAVSEAIPRRDPSKPCPLSPAQERLWFMEKLNPGVPVYNESEAVRLEGSLNVEALEQALNFIVARRDILRSTIQLVNEQPQVKVLDNWRLKLKRLDLHGLQPEQRRTELDRLLIDEPRLPYNLENEPGIRVTLIELGAQDHVFILMMHHIICDWSSEGIIWRELSSFYRALLQGKPATLPPLNIQHADYAVWQKQQMLSGKFERDLAYWKEKLRGAPSLLELPVDRVRPGANTYRGARKRFPIGSALVALLRECSREQNISLFNLFTAAVDVLLFRYSGSADICLGIPLADRERPDLQDVIGFLLHTHVLRIQLSGEMTFLELLGRVQKEILDLYTHRAPPFDQVVTEVHPERTLGYSPLFQVMLNWRDRDQQLSFIGLEGLKVLSLLSETKTSKFDLTFMLTDDADEIWLEVEYYSEIFDESRIDRMVGHFQTLLEGIVANPNQSISKLPLLTDYERQQVTNVCNRTEASYPTDRCLHELIEDQAGKTPDAVAVMFNDEKLTYRQLNERSNQVARQLQELGVKADSLVGICLNRSPEMVVALLGILKAGGAYVPMDASYPKDRLAFMFEDARPAVLLTQASLAGLISTPGGQVLEIDTQWPSISRLPTANIPVVAKPENLAYVIYTSGSTGKPKGVEIQHRSVVNFLSSMRKEPGLGAGDRVLAITTLSFDIAGLELWLPLVTGARVVIALRETAVDGKALADLIERAGVTVMQATPSTWQLLLSSGWRGRSGLKMLCGGEPWSSELARQLFSKGDSLWNLYGPTETTIWSAVKKISIERDILIGRPIANTQLYVLDQNLQPTPTGANGELHIGGDGLARGYLNRVELTAQKFVPDPFRLDGAGRLYKTGDLVRRHPDGDLEYLGRIDNQVKLRGFRIELGEIESLLTEHPSIREASVIVREDSLSEKFIVAYLISKNGRLPEANELRSYLQLKLPEYMIPSVFMTLERFPLTPNGKVDRKALPRPEFKSLTAGFVPPMTPTEIILAKIWCEVLGVKQVGVHDNFFELGGHSLRAMQLQRRIEKELGKQFPLAAFFQAPTVASQYEFLTKSGLSRQRTFDLTPGKNPDSPTLFCFHFAFIARLLAKHIGQNVRVVAVESNLLEEYDLWLKTGRSNTTLTALAKNCVADVQRIQPHGPYYLGGFCFGGNLAAEVAHQLTEKGEKIGFVALFNSYHHSSMQTQVYPQLAKWSYHLEQTLTNGWAYVSMKLGNWAEKRATRGSRSAVDSLNELETFDTEETKATQSNFTRQLLDSHSGSPFPVKTLLFRAVSDPQPLRWQYDPAHGWGDLLLGDLTCHDVLCSHSDLVKESKLAVVADKLNSNFSGR